MHVLATAGHVDHGKSTLVRALTGMEPDRWAEEHRRGMTIDLGYAWTTLPSGRVLALVDVPGHARFIGSMLAGLGPAPAVLLVVAADEGWCRQSAEHLAAIDALGLTSGTLAVTRSDLADPAPALAEALDHIGRSTLGEVRAVAVSGRTGAGIVELRDALDDAAAAQPDPVLDGPVRLWVDRAFTVRGSGTVVTGTLTAGTIRVGDELGLRGRTVRVRGLQSLGTAYDEVAAVARVAVNLRGVERADVERGDALLTPGAWSSTQLVDVRLSTAARDLDVELQLHVGTDALPVRVRPLGHDTVRLTLSRPVVLRTGDRALLRDPAAQTVAAGVSVLAVDPPPLTRRGAAAARGRALDLAPERRSGPGHVSSQRQAQVDALLAVVDQHARDAPLDLGVTVAAAQRALDLPDADLLAELTAAARLVREGGRIRRPGPRADLGPAEPGVRALEKRLRESPFAAAEASELAGLGLGPRELAAAEHDGRLLRVGRDVVLLPDTPSRALEVLRALPQPFTLGTARTALGTSRRVALPLLEHLDRSGRTRRVDAERREIRTP